MNSSGFLCLPSCNHVLNFSLVLCVAVRENYPNRRVCRSHGAEDVAKIVSLIHFNSAVIPCDGTRVLCVRGYWESDFDADGVSLQIETGEYRTEG